MDWITDSKGDWLIANNSVALIDGSAQVKQIIREHLRTFLGEFFLDTTLGVPYFQTIMQKGISQTIIEGIFKSQILSCDGVIELTSFTITINAETRKLKLDFSALTDNGPITMTEEL